MEPDSLPAGRLQDADRTVFRFPGGILVRGTPSAMMQSMFPVFGSVQICPLLDER